MFPMQKGLIIETKIQSWYFAPSLISAYCTGIYPDTCRDILLDDFKKGNSVIKIFSVEGWKTCGCRIVHPNERNVEVHNIRKSFLFKRFYLIQQIHQLYFSDKIFVSKFLKLLVIVIIHFLCVLRGLLKRVCDSTLWAGSVTHIFGYSPDF